jgi:hypothetical protein
MRVQINQTRQDGFSGDIHHLRVFWPVARGRGQDLYNFVSLDHQRALARRRSRAIEDSSATKNERAFRPSWSRFDHHPPRVIAHLRLRIEELSAILSLLLRPATRAEK